jgi:hypothetical protein
MADLTCVIPDCEKPTRPRPSDRGMCSMHLARWLRHGDPLIVRGGREGIEAKHHNWVGDSASYRAMHKRLTRRRGPAKAHPCVDCGKPAFSWSYNHQDPDERHSDEGQPYSLDPGNYDPRCATCHGTHDVGLHRATGTGRFSAEAAARRKRRVRRTGMTTCHLGHEREIGKSCKKCDVIKARRYRERQRAAGRREDRCIDENGQRSIGA